MHNKVIMSQRSAIQLELYEQCHSPSFVLIESRRLLIWVKSKVVALRSIARSIARKAY